MRPNLFVRYTQKFILKFIVLLMLLALLIAVSYQSMTQSAHAQSSPTHTIQPGETLSQIAERYGLTQQELMELNSITNPDAIVSGQILVLPAPIQATPIPVVVDETYVAEETTPIEHVVLAGESLSRIAERYGLTQQELMEINGITNPDAIVIGTRLRLTPVLSTEAAQPDEPLPTTTDNGNPIASLNQTYTIQSGDSIPYIALRFGVNEQALRNLNKLDGSTPLSLGQVIFLPATSQELRVTRHVELVPEEAPVDDRPRHTVKVGDSLGKIAQDNGLSLAEIMEANKIANPDSIVIGQEIILPAPIDASATLTDSEESTTGSATASAQSATPHPIGSPRSGFFYYMVKPGDTLSELAREFNSTQLAILEYNNLPNTETVYAGLELRIPFGPPTLDLSMPRIPAFGSRFVVSLSRQQCWLLEANEVRYAWNCSTGYGEWITRTGNFAVQTKMEMAKSTAYQLDMPYWLGIYDVGTYENGIHGLPIFWETGETLWEGLVGQPATFGCAMLDNDNAETLFHHAFLGMPVHIVQ